MSTIDIARDSTLQELVQHAAILAAKAELEMTGETNDLTWEQIQTIVRGNYADKVWSVGQTMTVNYTYNGTTYECQLDIVSFDDVELEDGETTPAMWLQWHYTTPEAIQFDQYEAFYYAEDGLDAGTYNITIGSTAASNNWVSGDSWQFTLAEDVPEGGYLAGFRLHRDSGRDISLLYVYSYDADYTLIETVEVSSGSDGTNLGTTTLAGGDGINADQRFGYGYNRWEQSACRQWLNSSADAGEWWKSQNDYDLPPDQLSSYPGFLAGFDEDFLEVLGKVKVTTALNTVEGLDDTSEDTYDIFFPASLEQEYITPQLSGVEGDYFPYWKEALGLQEPDAQYVTNPDRIRYALNNKSSAQSVRLRSAHRGTANSTWSVNGTGYVNGYSAYNAYRFAPVCCIC